MDKMKPQEITELVSALADGALEGEGFDRALALAAQVQGREAWQTYHLIGDVLRSGKHAPCTAPQVFLEKLQARLSDIGVPVEEAAPVGMVVARQAAANDLAFRWKMVAGFASVAAVAAVGWGLAGTLQKPDAAQLAAASQPAATVAGSERAVMLRDPRLDEFLAAHRQLGSATALQMPAGFLRNATFEQGAGR